MIFQDRETWFKHELENHRVLYSCPLCNQRVVTVPEFRSHMRMTHGRFDDRQLDALLEAGKHIPVLFSAGDCPFCDEWADTLRPNMGIEFEAPSASQTDRQTTLVSASVFKTHVAMHLEELATCIFATSPATAESKGKEMAPSAIVREPSSFHGEIKAVASPPTSRPPPPSRPPGSSAAMNKYWIPHLDIHKKVITQELQYYLGPEATVRPFTREVRKRTPSATPHSVP